jgi:hypothetical protein
MRVKSATKNWFNGCHLTFAVLADVGVESYETGSLGNRVMPRRAGDALRAYFSSAMPVLSFEKHCGVIATAAKTYYYKQMNYYLSLIKTY